MEYLLILSAQVFACLFDGGSFSFQHEESE